MIVAANICGVIFLQENQTPKLIMTHGLHIDFFNAYIIYKTLCEEVNVKPMSHTIVQR